MINQNLMTQNWQEERLGVVKCQLDLETALARKTDYNNNSWFAFGRFEADGHVLDYLFHIMQLEFPKLMGGIKYQTVVTVLDETTGDYYSKDYLFKLKDVKEQAEPFLLEVPNGSISGNWDKLHIRINEGDFKLDTVVSAIHYPVVSCGTSVFELLGMCIHQFSVPYMNTTGTLTWKGHTYVISDKGYTWFDRQWQQLNMKNTMKWSWMAIYLENGDIISVLDCDAPGYENGLVANLLTDGTQINGMGSEAVRPFKQGESEYYYNPAAKQEYPSHWHIDIPKIDAKLEITPFKKEQDIASVFAPLSKYEGVCSVKGTYKGKEVTGTALVELIGAWPKR